MKKLTLALCLVSCSFIEQQDPFDKPYSVHILNDNTVQLTNKQDTVVLLMKTYRKAQAEIIELDSIGFDLFDGKYQLADKIDNLFEIAVRSAYEEKAIDWIFWFVFENDFGEKQLEAYDGDRLICQTIDELYDYISQDEIH